MEGISQQYPFSGLKYVTELKQCVQIFMQTHQWNYRVVAMKDIALKMAVSVIIGLAVGFDHPHHRSRRQCAFRVLAQQK
ncbi:hypothetical protein [Corynebacterium lowii]|uniref:Uncharacterized protein n=1 Tax=Corynebacterium lowii TaxID=1544413 RepID=A0A0Q1AB89_9CORY|nr:hypothetical protein [Corynebacterium lowii]KQB83951.1 hypothetical protein Clow_02151 [Corynebacterium lowii]MDP9852800.1 hypothetical protein [Corynebacterium lowii]